MSLLCTCPICMPDKPYESVPDNNFCSTPLLNHKEKLKLDIDTVYKVVRIIEELEKELNKVPTEDSKPNTTTCPRCGNVFGVKSG